MRQQLGPRRQPARRAARVVCLAAITSAAGWLPNAAIAGASSTANTTLTIATNTEPVDIDPCTGENDPAVVMNGNVWQALTNISPTTEDTTPLLALSWKQDNPTTWTFYLRSGVKFQDGTPFNAADAVFSINRSLNDSKIACSDGSKVAEKLTPTAVNNLTLKVVCSIACPILPRELSYVGMEPTDTPLGTFTTNPIGTGPYKFVKWARGQYIQLAKWSGYWGRSPVWTKVTVDFRTEENVLSDMVKTGEADLAIPVDPEDTFGLNTVSFPADEALYLRLPYQVAPFNNIKVREAVQYAIDDNEIVHDLMSGGGEPTDQVVTPAINAYIKHYKDPFPYNLRKAEELLAEAKSEGAPVAKPVPLVGFINQWPGNSEVTQSIADDLETAGFKVQVDIEEPAEWDTTLFDKGKTGAILVDVNRNVSGDASSSFDSYLLTSGCCSTSTSSTLDALLTRADQSPDNAVRTERFQAAARYEYTKNVSLVPIATLYDIVAISRRISYTPNPQAAGDQLPLIDVTLAR